MDLELHFRNSDFAETLRTYLERRLQFALSGFGESIRAVTVRLSDADGRNGDEEKHCEIAAELLPHGRVAATETHVDLYVAFDRALRRLLRGIRMQSARDGRTRAGARFRRCTDPLPSFAKGGAYAGVGR